MTDQSSDQVDVGFLHTEKAAVVKTSSSRLFTVQRPFIIVSSRFIED